MTKTLLIAAGYYYHKGEPVLDADGNRQYTGEILVKFQDGKTGVLKDADIESGVGILKDSDGTDEDTETVNGCVPADTQGCVYEKATDLKAGNTSANSSYATNTNIDINSNAFTNVFGQAF